MQGKTLAPMGDTQPSKGHSLATVDGICHAGTNTNTLQAKHRQTRRRSQSTCSQHCGNSSSAVRLVPMRPARSAQLSAIRCRWPAVGFFTKLNKAWVSLSLVAAFLCSCMTASKIGTTSAAVTLSFTPGVTCILLQPTLSVTARGPGCHRGAHLTLSTSHMLVEWMMFFFMKGAGRATCTQWCTDRQQGGVQEGMQTQARPAALVSAETAQAGSYRLVC